MFICYFPLMSHLSPSLPSHLYFTSFPIFPLMLPRCPVWPPDPHLPREQAYTNLHTYIPISSDQGLLQDPWAISGCCFCTHTPQTHTSLL